MKLCLDIGNTQIYAGLHNGTKFTHNFRISTKNGWTSDQLGIFIRSYFREQDIDYKNIVKILISSVVPSLNYSVHNACIKYFGIEPFMIKPGLNLPITLTKYKNHNEIGADIVAGCVAANNLYPKRNLLIVDLGTATTIAAVNSENEFCGGVIMAGIKIQADALTGAAEKLSSTDIVAPKKILGTSTTQAIQSGIYFGHLASIHYMTYNISIEEFGEDHEVKIIGTGGFSTLFSKAKLFNKIEPDLILNGLLIIEKLNC